jgi:dCTP diphosphatase
MSESGKPRDPPQSSPDRLAELHAELRTFVAERDWHKFHDPKNLAMAVASEAGELVALLRWVAGPDADARAQDPAHRPAILAELADVAIAVLLLADRIGADLPEAIRAKLAINRANYPIALSRGTAERPPRPI